MLDGLQLVSCGATDAPRIACTNAYSHKHFRTKRRVANNIYSPIVRMRVLNTLQKPIRIKMRKYGGEVSERGAYSTEFTIIYYSSRRFLLFIYILFIYCYDFFFAPVRRTYSMLFAI